MTTSDYLREFILYFSIIQSFLLASYFLITKHENKVSNRILGVSLISYGLFVLNTTLFYDLHFGLSAYRHWFFNFRELFYLSLYALLFLYIKSLLVKQFSIRQKLNVIHSIPLIIIFVFLCIVHRHALPVPITISSLYTKVEAFNILFEAFYFFLTFWIIKRKYKTFRKFFSKETNSNYKWLSFLIGCFLFLWISDITVFILAVTNLLTAALPIMSTIYTLIPFVFINSIFLITLLAPKLYILKKTGNNHTKSELEQKELIDRLLTLLKQDKVYADPDLSLQKASNLLKINHKVLSALINEKLGQTFTDLINAHRIEESKKLLLENPDKTIQEIMYETGYNSKSAFNLHFKQNTGLTPKQFRTKR